LDFLAFLPDTLEDDIEDDVEAMWVASATPSNDHAMATETKEDEIDMASKREEVSLKEALHTEILINQALIDLLVSKGVITQEELMKQIEAIGKE